MRTQPFTFLLATLLLSLGLVNSCASSNDDDTTDNVTDNTTDNTDDTSMVNDNTNAAVMNQDDACETVWNLCEQTYLAADVTPAQFGSWCNIDPVDQTQVDCVLAANTCDTALDCVEGNITVDNQAGDASASDAQVCSDLISLCTTELNDLGLGGLDLQTRCLNRLAEETVPQSEIDCFNSSPTCLDAANCTELF